MRGRVKSEKQSEDREVESGVTRGYNRTRSCEYTTLFYSILAYLVGILLKNMANECPNNNGSVLLGT